MNPEAQAVLDEILKKDADQLTEEEKIFLRARRGYLKKAQLEEYAEVLNSQTSEKETVNKNAKPQSTN